MTHLSQDDRPDSGVYQAAEEPYIFTTIRYQPELADSAENTAASCNKPCPFYLLEHHWTRLQVAKWSTSLYRDDRPRDNTSGPTQLFQGLMNAVRQWQDSHPGEHPDALRIKLRAYVDGRVTTETYHPVGRLPMSSLFPKSFGVPSDHQTTTWTVVIDCEATDPSEATMYKTSDRYSYGRARVCAGIKSVGDFREVLLYSPQNEIMDGTIATAYFFRNGRWVTPSGSSGGLQGTTRRWSLENNLCAEDVIHVDSLRHGETIWLSNAVRGYYVARFVPRDDSLTYPGDIVTNRIARQLA